MLKPGSCISFTRITLYYIVQLNSEMNFAVRPKCIIVPYLRDEKDLVRRDVPDKRSTNPHEKARISMPTEQARSR